MTETFVVNVDRFTGRFAEELALSADKPQAIYRTVEKTLDMYEFLRRSEADGETFASIYLDAIDDAVRRAPLTKKQQQVLLMMLEGYGVVKIGKKLGMSTSAVSKVRDRIITTLAIEYAKAPEKVWKGQTN